MSKLYVENEGDMEHAIDYTVKIASIDVASKQMNIIFPNANLLSIFIENLVEEFQAQDVPKNCGLNISLQVARSIDE